jgi:hypothetical protein
MYKFDKKIQRKRVRNGEDWRVLMTITVTMTDDEDSDFPSTTRVVSGYPTTKEDAQAMGVILVAKFDAAIAAYAVTKAALLVEETALEGNVLDKIDAYLTANVGVI